VERTAGADGAAAPASTAGEEDPGEAGPVMVLDPASVGHPFSHLKPVYNKLQRFLNLRYWSTGGET
jgi:hypothetical protein